MSWSSGFLVIVLIPSASAAQRAIISMPSADTTPAGEVFVMHESQAHP